jgi:hypothetical protein
MDTGSPCNGGTAGKLTAEHSPPSASDAKNTRKYTSSPYIRVDGTVLILLNCFHLNNNNNTRNVCTSTPAKQPYNDCYSQHAVQSTLRLLTEQRRAVGVIGRHAACRPLYDEHSGHKKSSLCANRTRVSFMVPCPEPMASCNSRCCCPHPAETAGQQGR